MIRTFLDKAPFFALLVMLLLAMLLHSIGASWITSAIAFLSGIIIALSILKVDSASKFERFNKTYWWPLSLMAFAVSLFTFCCQDTRFPDTDAPQPQHALCGVIEEITTQEYGDRLLVRIDKYKNQNSKSASPFKIFVYSSSADCNVSDSIRFFNSIDWYFERLRLQGYEEMMMRRGILGEVRTGINHIEHIGVENKKIPPPYLIRVKFANIIDNLQIGPNAKLLIKMLLLGDRTDCSQELKQKFAYAGIAHIFALSGMHIAIILSLILWLLRPLNLILPSKTRFLLAIVLIWIFVYCIGAPWSTVRAAVMSTFMLLALWVERRGDVSLNALCASAFFILLYSPRTISDPSFQLSFFCVMCLMAYSDAIHFIEISKHPYIYKFATFLLGILVASIGTWAITA
ncbi:MAG: ComEC/Rec2 family competence protein [Prevotella sp.]|nr:ComEC/Rec2 family competence protein [Bacteroides sp.]MCM1365779.1 ComEC/Rec2 family competence protein [Prevotella sp.]MCM1436529.1 ComEC/Rec2 family competence protein [Prevotella sp.]